nr:AraC family transcriptional regulator [Pedobacter sp. ASV19]
MHSHLTLHLVASFIEILKDGFRPKFCSYPIKFANASLITIPEGQILIQSFSHYLFYFELIEYSLKLKTKINFTVHPAAFFLLMMLKGNTNFHSEFRNLNSQTPSGTFFLAHNEGEYHSVLDAGEHTMLLLTLRSEWLTSSHLPEFKPLFESQISKTEPIFTLAQCPIDKEVTSILRKMQYVASTKMENLNTSLNTFVNDILQNYHQMLVFNRFTTQEAHQRKANEIRNFINEHYAEEIVDSTSCLAQKFLLSEKSFIRLAKIAFEKPIHQHVIHLRMNYALKYLLTTQMQVHEIGVLVGYKNSHYFTRAFKKHFQVCPSDILRPL